MRTVTQLAVVDRDKCTACKICVQVCPVTAIVMKKTGGKATAFVDRKICQACTICSTRCPELAISMESRSSPLTIGLELSRTPSAEVVTLCRKAHMYPDQIVCYCHRIQAQEIVTAILSGAHTPEQVARLTGARTGCGVLCITGVIRLLKSAGLELKRAPGCQWYGSTLTIWDLPEKVMRKYDKDYYLLRDRKKINELFPGGEGDDFLRSRHPGEPRIGVRGRRRGPENV